MTVPSSSTATYVALLFGISATSDFTSITQTNVTWTFYAWYQNINSGGKSVEVWIGVPTGTPATSATIVNNVSCQQGAVITLFSGLSNRTDIIEDFNVGSSGSNQVTFPAFGTGGPAGYIQACLITSPSGTAITTGTTNWVTWGSAGYGVGFYYAAFASAAGFNGGAVWSENSSYAQLRVVLSIKGYSGIGLKLQTSGGSVYTVAITPATTAPPWSGQVSQSQSWNQFTQVLILYQYGSTNPTDQGTLSMTNMTFTYLGQAPVLQPVAGYYLHLELWIGYANTGQQPSWTGGASTLSWGCSNPVAKYYEVLQFFLLSGMAPASGILENGVIGTGSATTATSPFTTSGLTANTTGDLAIMGVSQAANSQTYYNYSFTSPGEVYSNGPCSMATIGLVSAGSISPYITGGVSSSYFTALSAILKAPGNNQHTASFAENFTSYMSETIQKALAHTYATETGIQAVIADSLVSHRIKGGMHTFTETIITMVDLGIVKDPGKVVKETAWSPFADTFSKVHAPGGPQTFSETITLADLGFSWSGNFHPTFSEVLTLVVSAFSQMRNRFLPSTTEAFTLSDIGLQELLLHSKSLTDTMIVVGDVSSTTHNQAQNFLETFSVTDPVFSKLHQLFTALTDAVAQNDTIQALSGHLHAFTDGLAVSDISSLTHSQNPTFVEVFTPVETSFSTLQKHFTSLSDTFTLTELFQAVQTHFQALAEVIALLDISSLTHSQAQAFADLFAMGDTLQAAHSQLLHVTDAFAISDVFAAAHINRLTLTDIISLLETFAMTYIPGSGGGLIPVFATGALAGTSAAAAVVAALIYATARGMGRATGLAGAAYRIAALLRGTSLLAGLAGQKSTDTGAASGGSAASGIEGAHLVVASGSTEGDGGTALDTSLWTAPTGEADGVSPEMDCETQCIFIAEGTTMPDVPGAAVAVATYAMLRLVAALRGSSLARAQVFSPIVATGSCEGGSAAEYVSIAIYGAEGVQGSSRALGAAGALFHACGECTPLAASSAAGTGNYHPGRLAGVGAGRSRATAVANPRRDQTM
jgi:hypothetical protein